VAAGGPPDHLRLRWHHTTIDGRLAAYGEVGDGPPLVFLHGWGVSGRSYARALPVLAAAGTRVIAPALPGFGRSDELPGRLTWEKLAKWVDDLLDHIGADEPAFLVGHSFGGGVATMVAWHYPDRARSLVLVNSVGGSTWRSDKSLADRPIWDWGLHLPTEWTRKSYRRVVPVVARDLASNLLRHPRNLVKAGRLAASADLRAELNALRQSGLPVTILWGDQDRVLPESAFIALCEAAGSDADVVDGRHSWLIADPEGFGEILTNSLSVHSLVKQRESPPVPGLPPDEPREQTA
jgi:pimeloyl-ACP methyl ester carboxylesterase